MQATVESPKRTNRKRRGRGEGSIFQRGDGYWVAVISNGFGGDGKRRRKTVYGKTKKEVQDKLKDEGYNAAAGIGAGKLTLGDQLTRWLDVKRTKLAPATITRYECTIENHVKPKLGGVRLDRITAVDIEQFLMELERDKVSARNRQLAAIVIGSAMKHAVKLKLILHNPVRDVDKPKATPREMRTWSSTEVAAFLKATKADRLHALFVLALTTGMRQGELFALEWSDVDFTGGYLTVRRSLEDLGGVLRVKDTKTGKGRRIDLPKKALNALQAHRRAMLAEGHAGGFVFRAPDGGHVRRSNVVQRSFDPAIERAGVTPIRFHDLRHTHATLLLAAGENPKVVCERLGHASIRITLDIYAHVIPTMQKSAVEKLNRLFA